MKKIARALCGIALIAIAGCSDIDAVRDTAYYEGYEQGAFEVCREIGQVSLPVKSRVQSCNGF